MSMNKDYIDKLNAFFDSPEGEDEMDKMITKIIENNSEVVADVRSYFECTWNGGSAVWNTGFCDDDCRSCPYSEGSAIVNGKKYRFKKALTEEECKNRDNLGSYEAMDTYRRLKQISNKKTFLARKIKRW